MEHASTDTVNVQTPDAALPLEQRLAQARAEGDPWANMAGVFKDDLLYDEWLEIMRENRLKDDEELGI